MNLLVIVNRYVPDNNPGGKIIANLLSELQNDYCIDLITAKETDQYADHEIINGVNVYRVPTYGLKKSRRLKKREKLIADRSPFAFFYRLYNLVVSELEILLHRDFRYMPFGYVKGLYYRESKRKHYDAIVTLSHPFYIQMFMTKLDKKKARWTAIMTDPHADNIGVAERPRERKDNTDQEYALLKKCDVVITQKEIIDSIHYSPLKEYLYKVHVLPLPILRFRDTVSSTKKPDGKIHIVFAGRFYYDARNPEKMLRIFNSMNTDIVLDLYSNGCEDIVEKYRSDAIISHGMVDNDTLENVYMNADLLLNIGNSTETQVPSKVLEYISWRKPIINLITIDNDTSVSFFEEYSLSITLRINDLEYENVAKSIIEFSKKHFRETVPLDYIREVYKEYTIPVLAKKYKDVISGASSK